jgi:hypothetical protein
LQTRGRLLDAAMTPAFDSTRGQGTDKTEQDSSALDVIQFLILKKKIFLLNGA